MYLLQQVTGTTIQSVGHVWGIVARNSIATRDWGPVVRRLESYDDDVIVEEICSY